MEAVEFVRGEFGDGEDVWDGAAVVLEDINSCPF